MRVHERPLRAVAALSAAVCGPYFRPEGSFGAYFRGWGLVAGRFRARRKVRVRCVRHERGAVAGLWRGFGHVLGGYGPGCTVFRLFRNFRSCIALMERGRPRLQAAITVKRGTHSRGIGPQICFHKSAIPC